MKTDLSSQIQDAIAHRHFQVAINLTVARFGYRPGIFVDNPEIGEGRIGDSREIQIGREAFFFGQDSKRGKPGRVSAAWLASSLFHETIHWDQRFGAKFRWGQFGTQGGHINEAEAYKAEIDRAPRHGLSTAERIEVQARFDKELRFLRPPYDAQVRRGDFSVPELFQVSR